MRRDLLPVALLLTATALALSGCSSSAAPSTLTVQSESGEEQTITVSDLQCVTNGSKFIASSLQSRIGDLSAFTATVFGDTENPMTWISLGEDRWFLTTEEFTHDGAVVFDEAEGRIGTSDDGYPTQFDETAIINGALPCTTQKSL
ncbi:hypothetical protein [Microbacterium sp.]|uniref:hypothetical protein n=1 Tax=Microbacterium sp. TaxID=51671 RepID=UPI0039E3EB19